MIKTILINKYNLLYVFVIFYFLFCSNVSLAQVGIGTTDPKSTFEVNGSTAQTVTTVTSNTTLNATHSIVLCNNGATVITITLPTAIGISGRIYTIKREDLSTANVEINTTSSQTIDGMATSITLTNPKEAVTVFSDGANWKKMSSNDNNNVQYPMGEVSYFDITGTKITISNTVDAITNMTLCNVATAFSGSSEFDSPTPGRLRYIGTKMKSFHIACTISVYPDGGSSDRFAFAVSKNGVPIPSSRVIQKLPTGDTQSTAMHVMTNLSTNDYLELYAGNMSTTGDVWIKTVNLFALGMYMGM